MPYIVKSHREYLDNGGSPAGAGELNYLLTQHCIKYFMSNGQNYAAINAVVGALECAKQEFYRRVAVPYEDLKKEQNGDVY